MKFSQKMFTFVAVSALTTSSLFCPPATSGPSVETLIKVLDTQAKLDVLKQNATGIKELSKKINELNKAKQPVSDDLIKEADAYLLAIQGDIINFALPVTELILAFLSNPIISRVLPDALKKRVTKFQEFSDQLKPVQELHNRLTEIRAGQ